MPMEKQQYHCKNCKAHRILESEQKYPEARKWEIIRTYLEGSSLRGLERIFHIAYQTPSRWIKKMSSLLPTMEETLVYPENDALELDEEWSFVQNKKNKRWGWFAKSRITKQIVAYFIGNRDQESCEEFKNRFPENTKIHLLLAIYGKLFQCIYRKSPLHQKEAVKRAILKTLTS